MDDLQKVRLALDAAISVLDGRGEDHIHAEVKQLKIENEQLKQKLDAEWMAGIKYAIYEIMKECEVPGSNEIRESGDSDDGMCAQAAEKICRTLIGQLEQLKVEIERLESERDAAISDLKKMASGIVSVGNIAELRRALKMGEHNLIGKTIESIDVTGYGIVIVTKDGYCFDYSASDGGYSSWDCYRKGVDNEVD